MRTHYILAVILATGGIAHADDAAAKNAKALAEEASQAFAKGDFG